MSQEAWSSGGSRHDADDTSDRLYTPEDFAAYAARRDTRDGGPGGREPITYGDPLTDPLPGAEPPAQHSAQPLVEPPVQASAAPTSPPPSYRPSTPPPSAPPPAYRPPVEAPVEPPVPAAQVSAAQVTAAEEPDADPRRFMSATDFLDRRDAEQEHGPATWGWRGKMRRWSGGLITPRMGADELAYEHDRATIQRDFDGPRTIAFINPKGGAAKTTGVLAAGFTFGTVRGGGVVAWDNNETRGTLGIRGTRSAHRNTTRELLEDLERFTDVYQSRIGDLGAFVRSQGDAHFDVLASDERPDVTGTIRASDFDSVHKLLERFYRVILIDTGNNMRAENWLAAAGAADLLVVTSTVREDTGYSGLWMLDALQDAGYQDLKHKTVTVLSDPSATVDAKLAADLVEVYQQRTRGVYRVPYDPALVAGSVVPYSQLSEHTRKQWLKACAGMAAAL
jgi:MinD-like ATPase involved in chromosome partitioning or flagellar assembly